MRLACSLALAVAAMMAACGGEPGNGFAPIDEPVSDSGSSSSSTGSSGKGGASGTTSAGAGGASGAAGSKPVGGAGTSAGGAGGTIREAGAAGSPTSPDAATAANCTLTFPTPTSTTKVSSTIMVTGTYDGMMKRFVSNGLGDGSQTEGQSPIFQLADGATLKNAIMGNPGADGIHCSGSCTLQNVWWEDVGEDAATLKGKSASQTMTIEGGGAMHAADKVFQHDGAGTVVIRNFFVSDFGKLYRSCGNCRTQYARHVVLENVTAVNLGGGLVGINTNYNDTATFENLVLCDRTRKMAVCDRYTGNNTSAEPTFTGSGPDNKYCIYTNADLQWVFF